MANLETQIRIDAQQAVASLENLERATYHSRVAFQSLMFIIRDLPYGFIAVSNNLDPLVQNLITLRAETGSTTLALQALGRQLFGPLGVVFAFSALNAILTYVLWSKQKTRQETDELKKK